MPRSTSRCLICRKPVATEADYERYEDGEGTHLCWEDSDACIAEALEHGWPTTFDEALARAEDLASLLTDTQERVSVLESAMRDFIDAARAVNNDLDREHGLTKAIIDAECVMPMPFLDQEEVG